MKLAVIPARGGSKRIPRKNIKFFCGKPMIGWSIEAALRSQIFDQVIVSTDDLQIADVARQFGAVVPFARPDELADDHTGTVAVIRHALQWFSANEKRPDYACCIYATAPFVMAEDIGRGFELLIQTRMDYVASVTDYPFPIQRALTIGPDGGLEMLKPENLDTRSQDLQQAYHDAGQFYWGRSCAWLEERPIFSKNTAPVMIPRYRAQDIDGPEDWLCAELMFEAQKRR
jgi:N-acylneuraminate cytidylyltransferase